jgi:DNA-binding MarR family transcriptional regulator
MQEIETVELIMNITRMFGKRFGAMASAAGLSMTEALALWKIQSAGGCKANRIASHLGLPPSTLTGMLDRLEAGGWITREADPEDRRALLMRATPKLKEFMKSARRSLTRSLAPTFASLPPDLMPRLSEDLRLVLACLRAEEEAER